MARVTDIRYVGYGVPDLEAERAFYRDKWGLREVAEHQGMWHFAAEGSRELYCVRLRSSTEARTDVIALAAANRADVDTLFDKVRAAGCKIIFEPRALTTLGGGYGFRFFSHDGLPFEVSCDVEVGTPRTLQPGEALPEKISHVVLHSPDQQAAAKFWVDVLGFRVSDWLGDFMVFLRCNEWHHRLAILPGPPCLNHVAYDMISVDDMMRGIGRLRRHEIDLRWGPGRHTAGNNTFSYFVTPNGFTVEYTADLDQVGEDWQPTVYKPSPTIMDQWGIGTGGPHTLPRPQPDPGLFKAVEL